MTDHVRVAVLIDCENVSHRLAGAILAETTKHGTVTVKRAYGDWSSAAMSGWRKSLPLFAIQPFQQFSYVAGKNSSDAALIVDAMDMLYSGNVDVFCIVSGDSDFTRLVSRLRESGRKVYGIGARTTHESFVNAFDRFTFTELLGSEALVHTLDESNDGWSPAADPSAEESAAAMGGSPRSLDQGAPVPELEALISRAVGTSMKDDGWADLATIGWYIVNNIPSFDSRNYGFPKLGDSSALCRTSKCERCVTHTVPRSCRRGFAPRSKPLSESENDASRGSATAADVSRPAVARLLFTATDGGVTHPGYWITTTFGEQTGCHGS